MNAVSQYKLLTSTRMLADCPPPPNGGPPPPGSTPPPGCTVPGGMDGGGMGGGGMGGGGGEALSTSVGIALSGGYIYNALAGGNTDASDNEIKTMDVCLSHPTPFSEYHYHFWGPCLKKGFGYWDDKAAPPLCAETPGCTAAPGTFTLTAANAGQTPAYTKANWDEVIGIARDGHMIIGPYKSDGSTWGCDRDVCNGKFIDGSYVYVGSDRFPYVAGCWGPGPAIGYAPTCSTNGCGKNVILTGAFKIYEASASVILAGILTVLI